MKNILIIIAFTLLSCQKEDIYPNHYEQVIIDPENPDYYFYSDSQNPENGWVEYWNGDYKYYFEIENGIVTIHPTQELSTAVYLRSTMDKNPVPLEISENNSVEKNNVTKNGLFRFTFR